MVNSFQLTREVRLPDAPDWAEEAGYGVERASSARNGPGFFRNGRSGGQCVPSGRYPLFSFRREIA